VITQEEIQPVIQALYKEIRMLRSYRKNLRLFILENRNSINSSELYKIIIECERLTSEIDFLIQEKKEYNQFKIANFKTN